MPHRNLLTIYSKSRYFTFDIFNLNTLKFEKMLYIINI